MPMMAMMFLLFFLVKSRSSAGRVASARHR